MCQLPKEKNEPCTTGSTSGNRKQGLAVGGRLPGTKGKRLFIVVDAAKGPLNFTVWNADSAQELDAYLGQSKLTIAEVTLPLLQYMEEQALRLSSMIPELQYFEHEHGHEQKENKNI
jgi:hypothetical protein